jgi:hypothetical protein
LAVTAEKRRGRHGSDRERGSVKRICFCKREGLPTGEPLSLADDTDDTDSRFAEELHCNEEK